MNSQQEYHKLEDLQGIIASNNIKNIFIVTGKTSYEKSGAKQKIEAITNEINKTFFSDFAKNPKIEDVQKGLELYQKTNSKIILAIGGGSVIDMAKSIALIVKQDQNENIANYITKKSQINNPGIPIIAVPTTAGSGSEATHFAVVYISKQKYSLTHQSMLPKYVILDSNLTNSLPKYITASTTMDAFSQALESYWSVNSTPISKKYAKEALQLILEYGVKNLQNPNSETKQKIQIAANLAGKAINISKTTACHAISYTFTSYFNIPHGHAVALTLPSTFLFNSQTTKEGYDINDPRGLDHVKETFLELQKILGTNSSTQAAKKIKDLIQNLELETSLSKLNINDCSELIISNINLERLKNNPRKMSKEDIKNIINQIQ